MASVKTLVRVLLFRTLVTLFVMACQRVKREQITRKAFVDSVGIKSADFEDQFFVLLKLPFDLQRGKHFGTQAIK